MSLIRALIIEGYTNHIDEWVNEKLYFTWYDGYPEHILPLLQAENYGEFEEISEFPFPQSIYDFVYYIDGSNRAKRLYTVLGYDWEFHRKYNVTSFKIIKEGVS